MLKNMKGFTIIETIITLILMSALLSIHVIQTQRYTMQHNVMMHQAHAYHILDNVLMEMIYEQETFMNENILIYNENFEKDLNGMYQVIVNHDEGYIKIYLIETMKEVLYYEYQKE